MSRFSTMRRTWDSLAVRERRLVAMAAALLLAVLLGTGGAIFGLLILLRVPEPAAATVAGAMTQIGEFSFLLGARVKGGLHGKAPSLEELDADGNLVFTTDFRSVYATLLEKWLEIPSEGVLGRKFETLGFV